MLMRNRRRRQKGDAEETIMAYRSLGAEDNVAFSRVELNLHHKHTYKS